MKRLARFSIVAAAVLLAVVCVAQDAGQRVVVVLTDGSRLLGTLPATTALPLQFGSFPVPIKRIESITMSDDHKTAAVALANGDKINGAPPATPLVLTTLLGAVPLDLRAVKTLTVIATGDAGGTDGLVLSNTLGSDMDLAHSLAGPAIKPYTEAKNGYNAPGQHEFVQGEHGKAVTIKGTYGREEFVHMLELDGLDQLIDPEQGTIEFDYCQKAPPVDWEYGVYRMFDGEAGLGGCVGLFSARNTIFFNIACGGTSRGLTCPITVIPNDQWIHMAVVWNRKGIEGTAETMRLYINGTEVAYGNANDWGTTPGGRADIGGGQNSDCAGKYMMSDLKVWKRALAQGPPPGKPAWQPPTASPATAAPAKMPPPFGHAASTPSGPTPPPFGRAVP